MVDDEELVRRCLEAAEGDTRSFAELVRRHQASILADCRYLTRASADAEDLAQEVFVKVYFKLATFEERARFRTWLQRIKVNHCLSYLKGKKGRHFLDAADPGLESEEPMTVQPQAQRRLERAESDARIRDVLASLPDSLRVPLVMCDMDGISYQDIARALGIGLSATKMRISRARAEFRRRYAGAHRDAPDPVPAGAR